MKKNIPVKVYQFIITDSATGAQELINNVSCVFRYERTIELFLKGGDVLQYSADAVTVKRA